MPKKTKRTKARAESSLEFKTWLQVAEFLGTSDSRLRLYRKRGDWPASVPRSMPKRGLSMAQVLELLEFRARLQADRAAAATTPAAIELKAEQTAMLRARRLLIEQRYIPRATHDAAIAAVAALFEDSMKRIRRALVKWSRQQAHGVEAGAADKAIAAIVHDERARLVALESIELKSAA